jgi:hypothetical protein
VVVTAGVIVTFIGIGVASGNSDTKGTSANAGHRRTTDNHKSSDKTAEAPAPPDVT